MTHLPIHLRSSTMLLVIALLFSGCAGESTESAEETAMAEAEDEMATETAESHPTALLYIAHTVAEFEPWLAAYEANEPVRSEHGLSEAWVYRNLDQPNLVHVLLRADDVETARHFMEMEELKTAMKEAGVTGEPTLELLTPVHGTQPETLPQSRHHVLVAHEIADWDQWKPVFDAHQEARIAAGLTLRGIARGVDNPNMIYLSFAASDLDAAREFGASEDLKSTMESAGVVGEPRVVFAETARPDVM